MTDPLINRDELEDAIMDALVVQESVVDAVLVYLREVLTPEALDPGRDLHRRIFGEGR